MVDTEEKKEEEKVEEKSHKETQAEKGVAKEKSILSFKKEKKAKKGDFVVQCHIIEARELKGRGGDDAFSDPVIKMECRGVKKHTKIVKRTANVVYDQTFFWEFPNLDPVELGRSTLSIAVYDANVVTRDEMIGAYEFGLETVYYNDKHEVYRQWVALDDPTDTFEGIQGYVRLSVTVLGPGDDQFIHPLDEPDDEELAGGMLTILMAPKIKREGHLLGIRVFDAKELAKMDALLGYCDPYVRAEFANANLKTQTKEGENANFSEEIQIPVMEPIVGDNIKVSMMDFNKGVESDDTIGVFDFSYKQAKEDMEKIALSQDAYEIAPLCHSRWYYIYGAPWLKSGKHAREMNTGLVKGSTYRGKLLMAVRVEKSEKPKKGVVGCSTPDFLPELAHYKIQFDLYNAVDVYTSGDVCIEVCLAANSMKSQTVKAENRICSWHEAVQPEKMREFELDLPKDPTMCPDIIIYLNAKGKRASYMRIPFKKAVKAGWEVTPKWYDLKEDKVIDFWGKEEMPGSVLASLRVGIADQAPKAVSKVCRPFPGAILDLKDRQKATWQESDAEKKQQVKEDGGISQKDLFQSELAEVGNLSVWVYEATDLPAADNVGKTSASSDPYIKVAIGSDDFETEVIKKNLNPKWKKNQPFVFKNVQIFDAVLDFSVFDEDGFFSKDDLLATGSVHLGDKFRQIEKDSQSKGPTFQEDWWIYPSSHLPDAQHAKIHIKVKYEGDPTKKPKKAKKSIFDKIIPDIISGDKPKPQKVPFNFFGRPPLIQYQLRAMIFLGRELEAADDNGFSDPYMKISYAGSYRETSKKEETLDPAWWEVHTMNVDLPEPLSLAPDVRCVLFDQDTIGRNDSLGQFDVKCVKARGEGMEPESWEPEWYALTDVDGVETQGRVLACFQLLRVDQIDASPIPVIKPDLHKKYLQIALLGARDLRSNLGISKPFISAYLEGEDEYKTAPSSSPSSHNPNYLQLIKMEVMMPEDSMFAPTLRLEVRDSLFGGLFKRDIGTCSIPISKLMERQQKQQDRRKNRKAELQELQLQAERLKAMGEEEGLESEEEPQFEEEKKEYPPPDASVDAGAEKMTIFDQPSEYVVPGFRGSINAPSKTAEKEEGMDMPLLQKEPVKYDGHGSSDLSKAQEKSDFLEKKDGGDEDGTIAEPEPGSLEAMRGDEFKMGDMKDEDEKDEPEDLPEYLKGRQQLNTAMEKKWPRKMKPFHSMPVFKGQSKLFKGSNRKQGQRSQVGSIKGLMRLTKEKEGRFDKRVNKLLQPAQAVVRVYVLRAYNLVPSDADGQNDPYLTVELGDQKFSTRKTHLNNTLQPEFYESFEIRTELPGETDLKIKVWDWDGIGDDMIGETIISLEDRWFSDTWKEFPLKPLERRKLSSPLSSASQGVLEMWVDMLTFDEAARAPMVHIKPPPPEPFQIRLIVWSVLDAPTMDDLTQQNDLYVTGILDAEGIKLQKTDVHYRAKEGKGNFNWRMLFPVELPFPKTRPPRLRLQVWDRDLFSANDAICEANISLTGLFKQAFKKKRSVTVRGVDEEGKSTSDFFIENMPNPQGEITTARIKVSVEILPEALASQAPAGLGRSDPNMNPTLPEPEGRLQFTGPLQFLKDILGDELFGKICGPVTACAICVFVVLILIFVFQFISVF